MLDVVREAETTDEVDLLPENLDREEFLRSMYPRLVGALGLQGFSDEEAEDLAQDTLVQAVRHWDKVAAASSPEGWLFRAASNLSRSWLRRLRVARRKHSRPPRWTERMPQKTSPYVMPSPACLSVNAKRWCSGTSGS